VRQEAPPRVEAKPKVKALIVFSLQIVTPDERRPILTRALAAMIGPTRVAPGCLEARLFSDPLNRRKALLMVEEWDSLEQFERNLDTAKLNAIVAAIELSSEAPIVRVDTVERREGMDVLTPSREVTTGAQ
jgi:quinol monooxygenase YgiN